MALERELVSKLKEQKSYSDEDISKTCKEYVDDADIRLPVDEKQVQQEIERYNFLQKYFDQVKNRRMSRKILKQRLKDKISKGIQKRDTKETLSIRPITRYDIIYTDPLGLTLCGMCSEPFGVKEVSAKGTRITELRNGRMHKYKFKMHILSFCTRCESIYDVWE